MTDEVQDEPTSTTVATDERVDALEKRVLTLRRSDEKLVCAFREECNSISTCGCFAFRSFTS